MLMDRVKTALEKALERSEGMGSLTPEERKEMRDREKIKSVLASFYKGDIKRDEIWNELRGSKPQLLKEAQENIGGSIRINATPEEFLQRRDGILAIEALKPKQNTAGVESALNSISRLQKEYRDVSERAVKEVRTAVEQNPQLRIKPVRSPDGRILQASMTVEEAVHEKLADFFSEHNKRYEMMFAKAAERLKSELR